MKQAKFYQNKSNKQLECQLCNHFCTIAPSKLGICQARKNIKGELFSLVYGYPIGPAVDPIEKKGLSHFYPASHALSIGTYGCNFACANCLNHWASQKKDIVKANQVLDHISPEKIVEMASENYCSSIAYTYNEPTIFTEYALDIMSIARERKIQNVWVSNGFMSNDCLDAIIPCLDAINIDLKSIDEDFYHSNCRAKLDPVLKNLIRLKQENVHTEITTLLIPSLSSDFDMLKHLAEFIADELGPDTPWHVTRFSPDISWQLKDFPSTADDLIQAAYEIGKEAGLHYVYVGNVPGDEKENTYCSHCGELAVRRFAYQIDRLDIKGRCKACDRSLDIIE